MTESQIKTARASMRAVLALAPLSLLTAGSVNAQIVYAPNENKATTIDIGSPPPVGSFVQLDVPTGAAEQSGAIIGSGLFAGIQKIGTGSLLLSGDNTYVGQTFIAQGALIAGTSTAFGTGIVTMFADTTLGYLAGVTIQNEIGLGDPTPGATATFDVANGRATQAGAITNPFNNATVVKSGAGTLVLTAANPFIGAAVRVDGGTLLVNGSIESLDTTVNAGGTLGGTGTVGNMLSTTTINDGTLAPGDGIGTLSIQGALSFTSASTYMVEISSASSDRTNVTGLATLGGATVSVVNTGSGAVSQRYTILHADGGFSGTFNAQVNTNLSNFTASLTYGAEDVFLNLALSFASPSGLTVNQQNVANALVNSFNTVGSIPVAFGALTPQGLTQASGEAATGIQQATFNAMDRFVNLLTDPFVDRRGGASPQASALSYAEEGAALAYAAMPRKAPLPAVDAFVGRWSLWAAGYGGTQTTDGNAMVGSANTTARIYGAAAGADYYASPNTLIGFAMGGAGTNYSLANGLGRGSSDIFQAGVYGRHTVGATYLTAALAYGWQDVTTDRTVLGDQLRARFDANTLSGRIEGGYRFAVPWMGVTPYAAGQFTTFFLPGYAEQAVGGTNTFALTYASKDATASRSELGVRTDKSFALNDAFLTLRGRAAWAHNFNTDRNISAIFQTLPASAFVVNGAAQAKDAALVSAGAEMNWRSGFSLAANFEGEFSNVTESYAGKGVVRYQW